MSFLVCRMELARESAESGLLYRSAANPSTRPRRPSADSGTSSWASYRNADRAKSPRGRGRYHLGRHRMQVSLAGSPAPSRPTLSRPTARAGTIDGAARTRPASGPACLAPRHDGPSLIRRGGAARLRPRHRHRSGRRPGDRLALGCHSSRQSGLGALEGRPRRHRDGDCGQRPTREGLGMRMDTHGVLHNNLSGGHR